MSHSTTAHKDRRRRTSSGFARPTSGITLNVLWMLLTGAGVVAGGAWKVEASLDEMLQRERGINDRLYAPARSMARIEAELKSVNEKLRRIGE